jgi:EAL domain-containing protein (putative c-di-GMP-specific phosphodiesterase class I)/glycosyltransferase involved in cell wall biosynthesis
VSFTHHGSSLKIIFHSMPNSEQLYSAQTGSVTDRSTTHTQAYPSLSTSLSTETKSHTDVVITVAIPTYNGETRLPLLLDRLLQQTGLEQIRWEIIVCDNGSTDDTAAIVRHYQKTWPSHFPLHYRFAAQQGAAFARQHAVESAAGELIAFLDDDNLPADDWLAQAYQFAQAHPQAGVFGSQIHGKFESELPAELKSIQCFLAIIERGDQPHLYEPAKKILPPAAGLVVRKQAWLNAVPTRLFLNNKGKEAGLASEDLEAILHIQKAGWQVWYNPDMVVYHDIPDGRLRKDYLLTLFRCVGLSRFHVRLLGIPSWKHSFAIPAYIANDIRKLALHRLRHGSRNQLSITESCQRVLLASTVISPAFLLKKVCADALQDQQDKRHSDRQQRLAQITQAFEQDQFALYQQPVMTVALQTAPLTGQKELLLRLYNDRNECILPTSFLPTAQRYGLMRTIDRWVIRHLFQQVMQESHRPDFAEAIAQGNPLYSINLSAESVQDDSLAQFIAAKLTQTNLPARLFCFEIAAPTALAQPDKTRDLVAALHQLGCQITLDDAVLTRPVTNLIKCWPINYIKLSSSLMSSPNMQDSGTWSQVHKAMQEHSVQAIAKGIESPATLKAVQERGIRYGQGYQIGRPQPLQPLQMG